MLKRLLPLVCLLLTLIPSVRAQEIPSEVRLEGLDMLWQQYNRCSATALYMQLSYYDYAGSATDIVRWLNPYEEDYSVRLEEMIRFAETQGLRGIARTGGTRDLMQSLVAGGFPVLVENAYWHRNDNDDWMSHNRILMGYDNSSFYFYDPLLGPGDDHRGYAIRYEEFDGRWRDFNRDYLVIYRPEEEARLQAILGEHWSAESNAARTLEQAQTEVSSHADAFSYYNLGSAQVVLGDYAAAVQSFDQARALGLPWRMFWYRFEIFDAYLQVGRYEDVIALVYHTLENTTQIQEMYYYIGRAYEGQGNTERALANYYAALARNANYPEAQAAIDALEA
ncbi:MAG: C39 family peptidase [Anaerolineae bacterium]|nr:C39 family peptidase [Anaerolineae bacterium]